jgi:putative phage-type endonuclease
MIDLLKEIIEITYSYFTDDIDNYLLSISEYSIFKQMLYLNIETFYPELQYLIPHLDNILICKYTLKCINYDNLLKLSPNDNNLLKSSPINFNQQFLTCEQRDEFYDKNRSSIDMSKLSVEQLCLFKQYEYLISLPQPVQKSKEWFDMRNNMITASNCGSVIGECKYSSIKSILIDKIGLGEKFKENKFVYHGKKYEKIAIMIYEIIYNSKVGEFGLIQHPSISYLGASPDGISMSMTLDGKPNNLIGRMLEIKCPPSRAIINKGMIKGKICPDYYWIQVQIQLECCDLPECDFWQCHLIEYKTKDEFLSDDVSNDIHTDSQVLNQNILTEIEVEPQKIKIDQRIRRGVLIELVPIDTSIVPKGELIEWYGTYIYPPTILMTPNEYIDWANQTISNIKTLYPELVEKYVVSKCVYWKLELSHNELITRQCDWFESNRKHYEVFWDRVKYYRNHMDEAIEDIVDQRLTNDIFLNTKSIRIPKNKSSKKVKDIFIKNTDKYNKVDKDIFRSSSEDDIITKTSKSQQSVNLVPKNNQIIKKQNDVFLSSDSDEINPIITKSNITKPIITKPIITKPIITKPIITKPIITKPIITKPIITKSNIKKDKLTSSQNTTLIKPVPVYKEQQISNLDDSALNVVYIMENRKKKNNNK